MTKRDLLLAFGAIAVEVLVPGLASAVLDAAAPSPHRERRAGCIETQRRPDGVWEAVP